MKYMSYRSLTEQLCRVLFRTIPNKKERERIGINGALSRVLPLFPNTFEIMDGAIITDEWHWLHSGRPMIFPESIATLENLMRGKFRVEVSSGIKPPYGTFVINVPKGYLIDGKQCPSILVSTWTLQERLEQHYRPLIRAVGMTESIDADAIVTPFKNNTRAFTLTYSAGKGEYGDIMARCVMDWAQLSHALSARDEIEYNEIIGTFPEVDNHQKIYSLDQADCRLQFQLVKLVVRMMVYIQATNALIPGFPSQTSDDVTPQYFDAKGKKATANIFRLAHEGSQQKQAHYRSFFIRQLRNERYYQGEFARMETGSRFVFVKDTYVGADVEANTLVEKDGIDA